LISNYTLVTKVADLIFMNTTEPVLPFLDFSTIPYEFSKLAENEMEKGTDSSQTDPWKVFKTKQSGPWPAFLTGWITGNQFRRDSSPAARGKGGELLRGLRRTQG
jgi:hypothetical protein